MGDLLIRNMPEGLKTGLSNSALKNGRSLSDEAKYRLRKSLDDEPDSAPAMNAFEAIRSAFIEAGGGTGEFAAIMDEIEAEGKRDFGRPVEEQE
jgi:plasmid stability protein